MQNGVIIADLVVLAADMAASPCRQAHLQTTTASHRRKHSLLLTGICATEEVYKRKDSSKKIAEPRSADSSRHGKSYLLSA